MAYCEESENVAVIFGATGLVGKELAKKLLSQFWKVYGVARNPDVTFTVKGSFNYHFISCDLLNALEAHKKLTGLEDVTHVFWVTWATQFPLDTPECCDQNKAMMSTALDAILPIAKGLKHVSLQTGMKHYVWLHGDIKKGKVCYYDEECPRVSSGHNFYYVLEDLLMEKLNGKVSWSVHRPGLLLGSSVRTLYNFMGSICVYGAICKHLNLPFVYGGTRECWEEPCIDGSDSRLVAEQHIWAATKWEKETCSHGEAFNAINGSSFTWKEIWPVLGKKFGVEVPKDMFVENFVFSIAMADKKITWQEIVVSEGLVQTDIEDLANWVFLDALFRCPLKLLGRRFKVDQLGFVTRYKTLDSIMYWIDVMREEKLIP